MYVRLIVVCHRAEDVMQGFQVRVEEFVERPQRIFVIEHVVDLNVVELTGLRRVQHCRFESVSNKMRNDKF